MRTKALMCRLRLPSLLGLHAEGSSGLLERPTVDGVAKFGVNSCLGSVRFMGFGNFEAEEECTAKTEAVGDDGKSAEEAVDKASQEFFRESNVIVKEEVPESTVKDHGAHNIQVEVSSEVWSAIEHDNSTSPFLDDSDKAEK